MKWEKQGLIYVPSGKSEWSTSHAQVPVATYLEKEGVIKVYFSTRDIHSRSLPGYVILDADNPKHILEEGNEPILNFGKAGTFDDCGVMPSWVVKNENEIYLYYIGWNVRNTIPYHNSVGLAISKNGGNTFEKFSDGPLWDRDHIEPHYSGTSCVLFDEGKWKNWYLSCTEWRQVKGKMEPRYHIKYAESVDGINWKRGGRIAIDYKNESEAGIVKASVLKLNGQYLMWYSYRNFDDYRTNKSNSYRIGFSTSSDGIDWIRKDNILGLGISEKGWDSEMVEYPHIIGVKNKILMFYNGNGFGKSGFGYAELSD